MVYSDLKNEKYYKIMCGKDKFITYFKYCSIIRSIDKDIIYLFCREVIYLKEKRSYHDKDSIIQITVNNNEIIAPIFPISKIVFYKKIRRCNETRRIEEREIL